MRKPPRITAVSVGMIISSRSRDRTRQFLSDRQDTAPVCESGACPTLSAPGPAALAAGAGRATGCPVITGVAVRAFLFRDDGTVSEPLTWRPDSGHSPSRHAALPTWRTSQTTALHRVQ